MLPNRHKEARLPRLGACSSRFLPFARRTILGIGDTDGVRQMIDWCARHGLGIFQTLPIGETGGDHCPYNAITALAIDPATLAVSPRHIADLSPEAFERIVRPELLAELRSGPVDYPRVKALKQALLQAAFEQFAALHLDCGTPRADKFRRFTDEHAAWLHDYAFFRALMWETATRPIGKAGRRNISRPNRRASGWLGCPSGGWPIFAGARRILCIANGWRLASGRPSRPTRTPPGFA